jgi:hypothetical protein
MHPASPSDCAYFQIDTTCVMCAGGAKTNIAVITVSGSPQPITCGTITSPSGNYVLGAEQATDIYGLSVTFNTTTVNVVAGTWLHNHSSALRVRVSLSESSQRSQGNIGFRLFVWRGPLVSPQQASRPLAGKARQQMRMPPSTVSSLDYNPHRRNPSRMHKHSAT